MKISWLCGVAERIHQSNRHRRRRPAPGLIEVLENRCLLASCFLGADVVPTALDVQNNVLVYAEVRSSDSLDAVSSIGILSLQDLSVVDAAEQVGTLGRGTVVTDISGTWFTGRSYSPGAALDGNGEAYVAVTSDVTTLTGLGFADTSAGAWLSSAGIGVSSDGTVVGSSNGASGAYAFPGQGLEFLPGDSALRRAVFSSCAITRDGSVSAGSDRDATEIKKACTWTQDGAGGWIQEFMLDPFDFDSEVRDLTDSGSFAGGYIDPNLDTSTYFATLWGTSDGFFQILTDEAGEDLHGAVWQVEELGNGDFTRVFAVASDSTGLMFFDSEVGYSVPLQDMLAANGEVIPGNIEWVNDFVVGQSGTGCFALSTTTGGYIVSLPLADVSDPLPTVIEYGDGDKSVALNLSDYRGVVVIDLGEGVNELNVYANAQSAVEQLTIFGGNLPDIVYLSGNLGSTQIVVMLGQGDNRFHLFGRQTSSDAEVVVIGGDENDCLRLTGKFSGRLIMDAGAGTNAFVMRGTGSPDISYMGGEGPDRVKLRQRNRYAQTPCVVNVDTGGGSDEVTIRSRSFLGAAAQIDVMTGEGEDVVVQHSQGVTLKVDLGPDRDCFYGGSGGDSVYGEVHGGNGDDFLVTLNLNAYGGTGIDSIYTQGTELYEVSGGTKEDGIDGEIDAIFCDQFSVVNILSAAEDLIRRI